YSLTPTPAPSGPVLSTKRPLTRGKRLAQFQIRRPEHARPRVDYAAEATGLSLEVDETVVCGRTLHGRVPRCPRPATETEYTPRARNSAYNESRSEKRSHKIEPLRGSQTRAAAAIFGGGVTTSMKIRSGVITSSRRLCHRNSAAAEFAS